MFKTKIEMEGRLAAVNFSIIFFRASFNFKAAGLLIHVRRKKRERETYDLV